MRTISFISSKGGVGKSTLALHVGVAAHLLGLQVGIVDLDKQASATKWSMRRGSGPPVASNHAPLLTGMVHAAEANGADLVIIDTAGHSADESALTASKHSDLVIIPVRPAVFDLEAVSTTHDLAKLNRKRAVALVNGAHSRSDIAVSQAQRGLRESGLEVIPVTIHTRSIFAASLIDGRTAMEHEPEGKAAKEILALVRWLGAELDLSITAPPRNRFPTEPLTRRAA